jgi:hypothetical protein
LFHTSKGHGGLFCSACHGSPHAIVPTGNPRDNVQNTALQGHAGTLWDCSVCHGYYPSAPGPHGIVVTAVQNDTVQTGQIICYQSTGTLVVAGGGTSVAVQSGGRATFVAGKNILFMPGTLAVSGSYLHGYISTNGQYCGKPSAPESDTDTIPEADAPRAAASSFRVWPNPTNGNVLLEMNGMETDGKFRLEIYTSEGVKLFSGELAGTGPHECKLTGYPAGIYFLQVFSENNNEAVKIIKL